MLFPDLFEFSPESIQGKKALVLSLQPMLEEAESERKRDLRDCENFTRCSIGKSKGRFSSFEYTDIDTKQKVDVDEFKKR